MTRVLLAEDDAAISDPLARALVREGYEVTVHEDGRDALDAATGTPPDLLVLDEATSAVDPGTEVRVQNALEKLTQGRTSVAIAHRLSTAENADVVVVMNSGRVDAVGHHTEVLRTSPVYQGLHASWVAQREDVA